MPARFFKQNYISFGTFRKSGKEVATPVWFAPMADKYVVFSAGNAGKVKRLRNSSRATMAPCDVRGKLKGDSLPASAIVVETAAEVLAAHAALVQKYGWQMHMIDFFSWLSGKKSKRAFIVITLDEI